jgi:xylose isomerase
MNRFFPEVPLKIKYEGKESKNPLAFKYYNPELVLNGKTMEEHLRFAAAYWHSFKGGGQDPFGSSTFNRPWNNFTTDMDVAINTRPHLGQVR